jgi:hypothetical protein
LREEERGRIEREVRTIERREKREGGKRREETKIM